RNALYFRLFIRLHEFRLHLAAGKAGRDISRAVRRGLEKGTDDRGLARRVVVEHRFDNLALQLSFKLVEIREVGFLLDFADTLQLHVFPLPSKKKTSLYSEKQAAGIQKPAKHLK